MKSGRHGHLFLLNRGKKYPNNYTFLNSRMPLKVWWVLSDSFDKDFPSKKAKTKDWEVLKNDTN